MKHYENKNSVDRRLSTEFTKEELINSIQHCPEEWTDIIMDLYEFINHQTGQITKYQTDIKELLTTNAELQMAIDILRKELKLH